MKNKYERRLAKEVKRLGKKNYMEIEDIMLKNNIAGNVSSVTCPVAQYLTARVGEQVLAGRTVANVKGSGVEVQFSDNVRNFINLFDNYLADPRLYVDNR